MLSRAVILKSLVDNGTPVHPNVDVQHIAAEAGDFPLSPLVFVGEYEPLSQNTADSLGCRDCSAHPGSNS